MNQTDFTHQYVCKELVSLNNINLTKILKTLHNRTSLSVS